LILLDGQFFGRTQIYYSLIHLLVSWRSFIQVNTEQILLLEKELRMCNCESSQEKGMINEEKHIQSISLRISRLYILVTQNIWQYVSYIVIPRVTHNTLPRKKELLIIIKLLKRPMSMRY
jgi:hypothetical protein